MWPNQRNDGLGIVVKMKVRREKQDAKRGAKQTWRENTVNQACSSFVRVVGKTHVHNLAIHDTYIHS